MDGVEKEIGVTTGVGISSREDGEDKIMEKWDLQWHYFKIKVYGVIMLMGMNGFEFKISFNNQLLLTLENQRVTFLMILATSFKNKLFY